MIAMAKKKQPNRSPYRAVRVPLELYQQLQAIAERNDRPVGREAIRALRAYVQSQGQGEGTTRG